MDGWVEGFFRLWQQGADDALALAFVIRGRHTGAYKGLLGIIQPTGIEVEIPTIDVLTLTEGKISAIWVRADDLGLLHQLGTFDRLVST